MAISQAYKDLEPWAGGAPGNRIDPEDSSLTPPLVVTDGWPDSFSDPTGNTPRRRVFNEQYYRETSALVDVRDHGILPWDADVDTVAGGVKQVAGVLYSALVDNGPSYGNAVNPTASGQTAWERVTGTLNPPGAPNAPTVATPGNGELDWAWNCPLDGGSIILHFLFQWRLSGTQAWSASIQASMPAYTLSGLVNGQAVEAQVRAVNAQGESAWSATGSATPAGVVPGGGATLALRATAGDGRATLEWLEPDDGGLAITSYTVQWRSGSQSFSSSRQLVTTGLTAIVVSLANGTEHDFRVRAANSAGNGPWSNVDSVTPETVVPSEAIPDRADAPVGAAGQGEITWAVIPPSDNGSDIISYELRWREGTGGSWSVTLAQPSPVFVVDGLTNGQLHQAQARTVNGVGRQTTWSPSGEATPEAEVPDRVQRAVLANEDSGIQAEWGEPEGNGAAVTGYDVQVDDNSAFGSPTSYSPTATAQLLGNLGIGTTYYVRVRARNSAGNGPWSPVASLQRSRGSAPSAPTALAGTPRRPLLVSWAWELPNSNGGQRIASYDFQWRYSGDSWDGANLTGGLERACMDVTVADTTRAVQARVRAVNVVGNSTWSGTVTVAAADLLGELVIGEDIGSISYNSGFGPSVTVTVPEGGSVVVLWGSAISENATARLQRNGVEIASRSLSGSGNNLAYLLDHPGAGSHTYSIPGISFVNIVLIMAVLQ